MAACVYGFYCYMARPSDNCEIIDGPVIEKKLSNTVYFSFLTFISILLFLSSLFTKLKLDLVIESFAGRTGLFSIILAFSYLPFTVAEKNKAWLFKVLYVLFALSSFILILIWVKNPHTILNIFGHKIHVLSFTLVTSLGAVLIAAQVMKRLIWDNLL